MFDTFAFAMSRTQESGAYLGGIGAMLEVADVCPSCGLGHVGSQYAPSNASPRECPRVVLGSFPVITEPEVSPGDVAPASQRILEYEVPALQVTPAITLGSLPRARRGGSAEPRSRGLAMPWLPAPDLGEVI